VNANAGGGRGGGWRRPRGCNQQQRWTLEITLLGLVQGVGVPAVLGGVSVVATYIYSSKLIEGLICLQVDPFTM